MIYRRIILPALIIICPVLLFSQDFPGYRSSNYTGVNSVFFNPANIADSRYRFDFNLISVSITAGNDKASFNLKSLTETIDSDSLLRKFVGKNAGNSSGMVSADVYGPSLLFNAGKKAGIALTTRARFMVNATDIDGGLAGQMIDDDVDITYPYTINSNSNMRVACNVWSEFGVSYARVLSKKDKHFVKGGITIKYLAGVANAHVNISDLQGTISQEGAEQTAYLNNATGAFRFGFGGLNLDDFDVQQLTSFNSTGFGADLGFVYEFRPDHDKYKQSEKAWRRDLNKYKLRLGIALLDFGSIGYERDQSRSAAYDIDITGAEKLDLDEPGETGIDELKSYFDSRPEFFTPAESAASKYRVSLPTRLNIDADYHLHRGFYINMSAQLSLVNSSKKVQNNQYYSSVVITPRCEGKLFGLYIPLSYNRLTSFNAGLSLRAGPLFIGSGTAVTALIGNAKQADFHFGLRFGALHRNQAKENK